MTGDGTTTNREHDLGPGGSPSGSTARGAGGTAGHPSGSATGTTGGSSAPS
ncbi:hypothetical protein SAMN04488570_0518 [Nocardioides scoriae]|uniref:Uncharacterized protein n=1 Tax=Nocardioides scoriae TaxID=642780 RepID=A0A1H1M9W5_9ACTN|nr:hypothetical protein SAMN04488570_0518 [Nocardioides scoriae]